MALAETKLRTIAALLEAAPEALLRALADQDDRAMAPVRAMAIQALQERRRRDQVLAPVAGLYDETVRAALWKAAKSACSALAAEAMGENLDLDPSPASFDVLCLAIAKGMGDQDQDAWKRASNACAADQSESEDLVARLQLAPVARKAQSQLPEWTRRMTDDRIAAVRLAYQDAVAISPDAGPRFFEMLAVGLDEPWLILRIISAAMHGPTEAYLSGSELSPFAQSALNDIDACIDFVRRFDPSDGAASSGSPAAAQASRAARGLVEFSAAIHLGDGAWSRTVDKQRKTLASVVENRLKEVLPLVEQALPRRSSGKRGGPVDLSRPPDMAIAAKAAGLAAFADALHGCADFGGFAAYRGKVMEGLDTALHLYVEEVLDLLRKSPESQEAFTAKRYLDVAADLYGLAKGDKAADVIRRRAAA